MKIKDTLMKKLKINKNFTEVKVRAWVCVCVCSGTQALLIHCPWADTNWHVMGLQLAYIL